MKLSPVAFLCSIDLCDSAACETLLKYQKSLQGSYTKHQVASFFYTKQNIAIQLLVDMHCSEIISACRNQAKGKNSLADEHSLI